MEQERSKEVVFISECLVNQNIRAYGVKNMKGQGPVREIVEELARNGIGFDVVPCTEYLWEGLKRRACGRRHYDVPEYRKICREVAEKVVEKYKAYLDDGYKVKGYIAVEGSPSCAVVAAVGSDLPGVFIEELKKELRKNNLELPFIGAKMFRLHETLSEIRRKITYH